MSVVLSDHLPLLASAPDGIQKLRGLILELAVRGKLVPQDPDDESASELLKRIAKERAQQEANGTGKKSKPTPAVSKDEQAFELPDGWAWVRFADVTSYIQRGKGPDYGDKSEYVVVSQKCVRWHGLDLSQARWITPESFSKYDTIRLLRGGDVLWNSTGTGTIGRAVVVPSLEAGQVLVADSHVTVVRSVLMSPIYLWRWIQSPSVQREIEGSASGSTNQIELATSTVTAHPLPLPPLAEQHRIVAKVDELMALCDRLEAEQVDAASAHARLVETLLGTLTQSTDAADLAANWQRLAEHFDSLFSTDTSINALKQVIIDLAVRGALTRTSSEGTGEPLCSPSVLAEGKPYPIAGSWKWYRMDEVVAFQGGSQPPKNTFIYESRVGYTRLVQIRDFKSDAHLTYIPNERANRLFSVDDVMIGRYGPPVFQILRGLSGTYNVALMKATPVIPELTKDFLFWLLQESRIHDTVVNESERTAGQTGIRLPLLHSFIVGMPPSDEQQYIVAKIDELMALCDNLKSNLATARMSQSTLAHTLIESALEAA